MSNSRAGDQAALVHCVLLGRPERDQDNPHPCAWCPEGKGGKLGVGQGPARDLMMGKGLWGWSGCQ